MQAVVVTGHIAMQNSSIRPRGCPKPSLEVTAPTHGGMAMQAEWV